jgi:UPF0755 protein
MASAALRRATVLPAVAAIAVLLIAFSSWQFLQRPFSGWSGDGITVTVDPGMPAGAVLVRLVDRGVIRNATHGRLWLALNDKAGTLQSGEYRFDRAATLPQVLARIEAGDVLLYSVTLPEGLTQREIAQRFEESGIGDAETLLEAFGNPRSIVDLDPEAEDLEGYLFPDTYRFPKGESAASIRDALVKSFRDAAGSDYAAKSAAVGLTLREAVTLASMIEEETSLPEERPRISRVFHNRIERGMRMECDPTVVYGIERGGREVERLTTRDLRQSTPWNTYVISGLPHGPIANPGRESLLAAINPAKGRELFFVAAPGGGHRFSEDLAGHNRAVAEWRRHQRSSR